jgi:hypothetical protein
MTWGQLRLSLQTSAPGVSLDIVDEFLKTRYAQILGFRNWQGLRRDATVQTTAAYQSSTDSVALTVGSATVTGTGTSWTSGLVGMKFYRPGDAATYRIASVASGASLTLDRAWEGIDYDAPGTAYTGAAYVLMQNVYPLPADCRSVIEAINPLTGYPLVEFSRDRADSSWGPRTFLDNPAAWALYDNTSETSPPVLHQIEFFPPPLYARGIPIEYLVIASPFTGDNTSDSPLPWVPDSVLLFGCRADIRAYLEDYAGAQMYEAKYESELARMALRDESERKKPQPMRMASRFTRHRLARVVRGLNRWPRIPN